MGELSGEDRIYVNMGGEITTAAPTGIAGTDVARLQLLQEPVAEPFTSKFEKKTDGFSGVVALLKKLIADVEKDSTEAQTEEKNSQEQYEEFMGESSASRADKLKEIGGLNDYCSERRVAIGTGLCCGSIEGPRFASSGVR